MRTNLKYIYFAKLVKSKLLHLQEERKMCNIRKEKKKKRRGKNKNTIEVSKDISANLVSTSDSKDISPTSKSGTLAATLGTSKPAQPEISTSETFVLFSDSETPKSKVSVSSDRKEKSSPSELKEKKFLQESRFILEEHLGTGGVCEVYKALDLRRVEWGDSDPYVAIKRLIPKLALDTKAQMCLIQEFRTVRYLQHHGIINFFDIHKEPFGMCCSMELLKGSTLKEEIIKNPLGRGKSSYPIIISLLDVLDFLHAKNIAHGDIKPANIFIESNNSVVLIDFNVADVGEKNANEHGFAQKVFQTKNPFAHCSHYSSPEQLKTGIVSLQSDIFSVACCIYQLFQGSYPFSGNEDKFPIDYDTFPKKPNYMSYYRWYILKCALAYEPQNRPTAKELLQSFREPLGVFFATYYFCRSTPKKLISKIRNFFKLSEQQNK